MAILTKFLKLLKPERNDYVDVDKHISENYDKIDSKMQELDKKASKTELGRVKIGDNLTITEDGVLSGNPEYTHPVGAGYKHIPAGGTTGQVLKNNGDGSAEWGTLDIKDKLDRGNLPATIPDAKTFYDLIEKGYGAELDENLFYLNDSGTKQVGYLYFDKNKKGLFRCIKQTTGTVNSTEYFVDASPSANYDRFGNLGNCHNFYFNEGSYDDDNFNILSHKASSHNEFTTVTLKIKKQGNYLLLSHRMAYTEDLETIHNITINNKKVAEAIADDRIYHNSTLFHICNLNLSDTIIFNYSLNTVINEVTPKISIVYLGY